MRKFVFFSTIALGLALTACGEGFETDIGLRNQVQFSGTNPRPGPIFSPAPSPTPSPLPSPTPGPNPSPTPAPSPSPTFPPLPAGMAWGVNAHLPSGDMDEAVPALDRAVEMHMSYVRLDMRWDIVEPSPRDNIMETGDWRALDASVSQSVRRGLRPLLILGAAPAWASTNGAENGTLTAEGIEHYREYVRAIGLRYRGYVEYFEIYNEPNLRQFWIGTTDQYVDQLLIPAIEVLRSIDSRYKTVGPSLSGLLSADIKVEDFFRRLGARQNNYIASTGRRFFDVISHHSYNDNPSGLIADLTEGRKSCFVFCVKQRDSILKILSDNGFANEPIWLDEFGWTTNGSNEDQVGRYILESLQRLASVPRLQAAFVYHLSDDPRIANDYGLLYWDGSPKRAYEYLRNSPP